MIFAIKYNVSLIEYTRLILSSGYGLWSFALSLFGIIGCFLTIPFIAKDSAKSRGYLVTGYIILFCFTVLQAVLFIYLGWSELKYEARYYSFKQLIQTQMFSVLAA